MRIKHYGRFFMSMLILALALSAIGMMVYRTWYLKETAYEVNFDTLNIDKTYQAVIFRRETLVRSNVGGTAAYATEEGSRIKRGEKVMEIQSDGQTASALESSEALTSVKIDEMLTVDIENLNKEIEALDSLIHQEAALQNFERVGELKQDLMLKLDKKMKLLDDKSLLRKGASSFKQAYVGSLEAVEGELVEFFSQDTGIVSYKSDALEQTLTIENLYTIDYQKLFSETDVTLRDLTTELVAPGSIVYRLVDPSTWFIAAQILKEEIDLYEKDKVLDVEFEGKKIVGSVADVFENGGNGILVVKINELHPDFYTKRFVDTRIIRENFQGLKVRKSSIVTLDNVTGVFVLDIDHRALFRPVKILGYNEDFAIVKDGYLSVEVDGALARVKTLEARNLVLIDPAGVKPGDKFEQR
ncbi:HlyD family efflux transporter periplasmic adaptor subunit [Acidaminobacter hydrogenoformans]|uniref:HlyD family secretion protein n=1 Tax=Acidaminobacter hydrogenoformans DSM 2784 TaxID=1120920 RepID=A0A1G5RT32_9FIRM|nr:HlyD family efflux transporter periplasmic adaptor subunit [Acidaminobacter hydrogenoformans]SCZ76998.1 HlyD family secretion protein [Acidaminobacter hydrogenoformans DSM 2784]